VSPLIPVKGEAAYAGAAKKGSTVRVVKRSCVRK
jgi:hypothetical protein